MRVGTTQTFILLQYVLHDIDFRQSNKLRWPLTNCSSDDTTRLLLSPLSELCDVCSALSHPPPTPLSVFPSFGASEQGQACVNNCGSFFFKHLPPLAAHFNLVEGVIKQEAVLTRGRLPRGLCGQSWLH